MAIKTRHKEIEFGVGDKIKVTQRIKEGDKERTSLFEGIVISIKGRGENQTFTVRRIGEQKIGIERIFPLLSPTIDKIEVARKGVYGVRRAKLYYIRHQAKREIEEIYTRSQRKNQVGKAGLKNVSRKNKRKK